MSSKGLATAGSADAVILAPRVSQAPLTRSERAQDYQISSDDKIQSPYEKKARAIVSTKSAFPGALSLVKPPVVAPAEETPEESALTQMGHAAAAIGRVGLSLIEFVLRAVVIGNLIALIVRPHLGETRGPGAVAGRFFDLVGLIPGVSLFVAFAEVLRDTNHREFLGARLFGESDDHED
ncbi:MAG: hypothetical protein R3C68_18860 [Myxococcota bacterium]